MNLPDFRKKHGEEAVRDLFMTKIIYGTEGYGVKDSTKGWLSYCKKHKLCGKGTKYMFINYYEYKREDVKYHTLVVQNGRNQDLIRLYLTDEEHKKYMGE